MRNVAALIVALMLAGCGGGDSGGPAVDWSATDNAIDSINWDNAWTPPSTELCWTRLTYDTWGMRPCE